MKKNRNRKKNEEKKYEKKERRLVKSESDTDLYHTNLTTKSNMLE